MAGACLNVVPPLPKPIDHNGLQMIHNVWDCAASKLVGGPGSALGNDPAGS